MYFVSVCSDKTINIFDGKVSSILLILDEQTGEYIKTLPAENAHTKGLYGVGWDTDSTHIYTASADCTVKVLYFVFLLIIVLGCYYRCL